MSGRGGAGTRGPGRPTRGERWAPPGGPGGAPGAPRRDVRRSRLLARTHSRERLGPRANQSRAAAATSTTGRVCSAPSSPATSLRPKTALGRSCYGSSPAGRATPRGKVPLLLPRISRSTNATRGGRASHRQSPGFSTRAPRAAAALHPSAASFPQAGAAAARASALWRSWLTL